MSADRPINADVPSPEGPEEKPTGKPQGGGPEEPKTAAAAKPDAAAKPKPDAPQRPSSPRPQPAAREDAPKPRRKPKPPKTRRRRKPIPGAIKLVAGLVALAIIFIVAVIVGGTGGAKHKGGGAAAPAPVVATPPAESESGSGAAEEPAVTSTELGFPGFATDNTTRVGGSSPAENAAAVALAVFPSTTPAQRPEAVALVDETDWPAAIAAAVLMAPPLRMPLLLSGPEGIPDASEEAWEALDPQGGKRSGGARGFAFGEVTPPDEATGIEQVLPARAGAAGAASPAANAAAIAEYRDRLFGSAPQAVLVAPLADPALAMPAAAWAARSGDPVLFAEKDKLPEATAEAISRHTGVPVYVLGPKGAISDEVLGQIKKLGPEVKRVAGEDPVANALTFARFHDGSFGWNINEPGHGFVLIRDDSPLDAAAASALSASGTWGPLLLTDSANTLPAPVRSYLLDMKPGYETNPTLAFYNHVWVIGDQEAISVGQQAEVNELAEVAKIGGEG